MEVIYRDKCPINPTWEISSPKCQECENYISHELISDYHGRAVSINIQCKQINKNTK